jgi:hypothetical protein
LPSGWEKHVPPQVDVPERPQPAPETVDPEPAPGGCAFKDSDDEIAHLRAALETRDAIGQAKGIIRLLTRSDAATAFEVLCQLSQDTNRKVKDVAVLFAECACSRAPLPPDLAVSWRRRTGGSVHPEAGS